LKLTAIEIRLCKGHQGELTAASRLPGGARPAFVVVSLETDEGLTGRSFGFATLDPYAAGHAMAPVRQFFLGRDPIDRERAWLEFRRYNRNWTHAPIYAYGPFDNACWDIVGQQARLPLHKLLGGARDKVPTYVSSMFLPDADAYVAQALQVKAEGYHGYKVHPPGEIALDFEVYRAVRDAVGPDFALMCDPVGAYDYAQSMRVGRLLEDLGYLWFEEPVYDSDWQTQAKLTRDLDIPILGTETLAGAHQSTAHYISGGLVDAVRTDVSWRGGVTGAMKVATLADAFGMKCEFHTCVYHALDLINLHCAAAVGNCDWFELLYPLEDYDFALKTPIRFEDGYAIPPDGPGLGIDYDWDFIEDNTIAIL
jgi:L-alanine-DL-glutamate epimerase-like enolase superfamily enzyme